MNLDKGFKFNQSNLQDYIDCQLRYKLKYIDRLAWPAVGSEPFIENAGYLERGARFHKLVYQYLLGIPAGRLDAGIDDPELRKWWGNFLSSIGKSVGDIEKCSVPFYPEIILNGVVDRYLLIAKFDLILITDDQKIIIYDWKTYRNRPKRNWLLKRMQTRFYRYLFAKAGSHLVGGNDVLPEMLEMVYWFANFPNQPERFDYDNVQFAEDQIYINNLISEISRLNEDEFAKTQDIKKCMFCVYRSFCDRGKSAGDIFNLLDPHDQDEDIGLTFDYEQVGEIEF